ncbi:MAG: ABC transporter permease [Anaerolineae bacterium]|nr:ABC transporter permease [Anaerolineae bacterium]
MSTTTLDTAPATPRALINWRALGESVLQALLSFVLSLLVGGLLLLISGRDPIAAYRSLYDGAFGSTSRFTETLVKATPLLFVAVSVSISFRAQLWNIGAEGQMILGAIFSTWVALNVALPPLPLLILAFLAAALGGMLWGLIAGVLKAYLQANEVITTSMLNYIAIYLLAYLVRGPMMDPQGFNFPQSALIARELELPRLVARTRLNVAFIVALVVVALSLVLWRTTLGRRIEIVGASRRVAAHVGLNIPRTILLVAAISGALAGLAGWGEIFGLHFRLIEEIARGFGTLGIVVALLGGLNPIGMTISAFLFAALVVGGNAMERNANVPFALVDVIQGCVILLVLSRAYLFKRKAS